MKVNEMKLLAFLVEQKKYLEEEFADRNDGVLPVDVSACDSKIRCIQKMIAELESICDIRPEDYFSKYCCLSCGWVGDEPEIENREDVYIASADVKAFDDVVF